jgi:hypothetical protein
LGAIVTAQMNQLANDLSKYELTMREKIDSFRKATIERVALKRAADSYDCFQSVLARERLASSSSLSRTSRNWFSPSP